MTVEEEKDIEHRLTAVENRAQSNTHRLDKHDALIKENTDLIGAIKELAVETKYLRSDLNQSIERLDKLERKDEGIWDKFKWLIVTVVVTIILGYLAVSLGLK